VKANILWEDTCEGIVINITNDWIFSTEAKWAEEHVEDGKGSLKSTIENMKRGKELSKRSRRRPA